MKINSTAKISLNKKFLDTDRVDYLVKTFHVISDMLHELDENFNDALEKGCDEDYINSYYDALEKVADNLNIILIKENMEHAIQDCFEE